MSRRLWVSIHLYLAAFFAPIFLMMAASGGLYLLGEKGSVLKTDIALSQAMEAANTHDTEALEALIRQELSTVNAGYTFEYLKIKGQTVYTRPTSTEHYEFHFGPTGNTATLNTPSLQSRMIELHKGHGPGAFKTFQKAMAAGLIIVMLSGLWLGLSSSNLRTTTLITSASGLVVFFLLALL